MLEFQQEAVRLVTVGRAPSAVTNASLTNRVRSDANGQLEGISAGQEDCAGGHSRAGGDCPFESASGAWAPVGISAGMASRTVPTGPVRRVRGDKALLAHIQAIHEHGWPRMRNELLAIGLRATIGAATPQPGQAQVRGDDAGLADGGARAPELHGVAGQAPLVQAHVAEVLPDHVLSPTFCCFLVAALVRVPEALRAHRKAGRPIGATSAPDTCSQEPKPNRSFCAQPSRTWRTKRDGRAPPTALRAAARPVSPADGMDRSSRPRPSEELGLRYLKTPKNQNLI